VTLINLTFKGKWRAKRFLIKRKKKEWHETAAEGKAKEEYGQSQMAGGRTSEKRGAQTRRGGKNNELGKWARLVELATHHLSTKQNPKKKWHGK